jgi:hypothetical protein
VASQLFAYGGVPGFFAIVAEMRDPKQYTRAMAVCQGVVSVFYLGDRGRRVLFLRVVCELAGAGVCWRNDEEGLLWACAAEFGVFSVAAYACMLCSSPLVCFLFPTGYIPIEHQLSPNQLARSYFPFY